MVKRTIALLLSVATVLGVVGFAMSQPASAALLESPNGKLLPDKPLQAPLDAVLSTVKGVQDTIAALTTAVTAIQTGVNGDGTSANPGLKADILAYIAELQADPTNAPTSAPGFLTGALVPPALTVLLPQVIGIVAKIAQPVCPIVGAVASLQNVSLPTIPDYSIFGNLAPIVKTMDQTGQNTLSTFYANRIAALLAPPSLPAAASSLAPYVTIAELVLSLLKTNWHSVYYPPDDPTHPIIHDTPGVMFLPMLIDVDNNLTFDICANMGVDLLGGTGKVNQQIDRIPTSDPNMKVDLNGSITIALGTLSVNIGYGIDTTGSNIPAMFETNTNTSQNPASTTLGVPGKTFAQYQNTGITLLGSPLSVQSRLETTKPPHTYDYSSVATKSGTTTIGTTTKWNLSERADRSALRTHTTGVLLGFPVDSWSGLGATTSSRWEYCTSTNNGFCNNAPTALKNTETASTHFTSSQLAQLFSVSTANPTACPTDMHITGTKWFYGAKIPTGTTAPGTDGHAWVDTDGTDVTGCQAATSTYPATFKAQDRLATWSGSGPALTKTGTITCPTGTLIKTGAVTTSNYLCTFAPTNSVAPSISGNPFQQAVLTAAKGTWAPTTAPNIPNFSYQWQQCTNTATPVCTNIAGASGPAATTYSPTAADLGKKIVVVVTGTNFDGTLSVPSAPTAVIVLPPAPVNTAAPVITGTLGSGNTLTASTGTWNNSPVPPFTYKWESCDIPTGLTCTTIGTNASTYAVQHGDENSKIQVTVTAHNLGGDTSATSAAKVIPPHPANSVLPIIKNGSTPAAGQPVFQGDLLKVNTPPGTWTDAASFTYQWTSCSPGSPDPLCGPIPGPGTTGTSYSLKASDIGNTIGLTVTAHNANTDTAGPLGPSVDAAPTAAVVANSLNLRPTHDVPDGTVNAAAATGGDTNIIGGAFDTVGKLAGKGGAIGLTAASTTTGTAMTRAARANGTILATMTDLLGGYFIGGQFTTVQGVPCKAFAHIDTAGVLDTSYCGLIASGEVRSIISSIAGTKLIGIAGSFVSGSHNNLLFVDPAEATLPRTALFNAGGDPDGAVNSISSDAGFSSGANGNRFVLGGEFTHIGVTVALGLAQVLATAGTPVTIATTTWAAGVCNATTAGGACNATPAVVKSILWSSLGALTVGSFNAATVNGGTSSVARGNGAVFATAAAGTISTWNPNTNGPINAASGGGVGGTVATGLLGPYTIYLGGSFTSIGGSATTPNTPTQSFTPVQAVHNLAEYGISATSAQVPFSGTGSVPFAQNNAAPSSSFIPNVDGPVNALITGPATSGSAQLFIGGDFKHIDGVPLNRLAATATRTQLSTTYAISTTWTPAAGASVKALYRDGTNLFVGGAFKVLGGVIRNNVAELTSAGDVTTKDGLGTNGTVNAIALKGNVAYVGGTFTSAGNSPRANLAAFDYASGGAPVAGFNPGTDGAVNALASSAGGVLVGGAFGTLGGASHANLGEVNALGGPIGSAVGTDGPVNAINVMGDNVYVGGAFTLAGGQGRANLAAITYSTGTLSSWNPGAGGPVNALASNLDGIFVGGAFSTLASTSINNLGLVDSSGAIVANWLPEADGAVRALTLMGTKIFAGGTFANIGGMPKANAAQLDADPTSAGAATNFGPDPDAAVNAITVSTSQVLGLFGNFSLVNPGPADTSGVALYGV